MIRRYFLRFLAVFPLAALAAPQSARGQIAARADLLLRMGRIHALRRMIDACDRDLEAIRAKYEAKGASPRNRTFEAAWFAEADPLYRRASELEKRLEELEREPLDTLMGDADICLGGAL